MSKSEMNADALRNPEIDPVSGPTEEPALPHLDVGIAELRSGPISAIVLSSAAGALLHAQYDWFGIASIAVAGLYPATVVLRYESLFLTMLLHATQNAIGTLEIVVQEHWLK